MKGSKYEHRYIVNLIPFNSLSFLVTLLSQFLLNSLSLLGKVCCIPTPSKKGEGLLRKISSQRKNYGRHESQTLESSRRIRRDYKCCLCFLGRRYGIPFSALHFSHEIPRLGLGILLESLLSSWQKQFRHRVERCQEIFTNPHWCLMHVACMAVICHSLSRRGEEKKWRVPQGIEHMFQ